MKVVVVRGGGLAGLARTVTLDSADLEPAAVADLQTKVEQSQALSLETSAASAPRGADAFSYEVTVQDESRRNTVRRSESQLTPQLRELVSWVTAHPARRREGPSA